jgi:serralysin
MDSQEPSHVEEEEEDDDDEDLASPAGRDPASPVGRHAESSSAKKGKRKAPLKEPIASPSPARKKKLSHKSGAQDHARTHLHCSTQTAEHLAAIDKKLEAAQEAGLTVNVKGGRATIWDSTRRRNLTWSFSSADGGAASFTEWAAPIRKAFDSWEAACGVNFTYRGSGGVITVRWATADEEEASGGRLVARAFFPGDSPRDVVLYELFQSYGNSEGVLRHELGHVLGFRHEHVWFPDNPTPGEEPDDSMALLTAPDPNSVMNYKKLRSDTAAGRVTPLSRLDIIGARMLYGAPMGSVNMFTI